MDRLKWNLIGFFSTATLIWGCGAKDELGPKVPVKVVSTPYSNTLALTEVNEMLFCVTQVKLQTSGPAVDAPEVRLGLVDVSNAAASTTWGELEIQDGAEITGISMEVHKDSETCEGAEYSLRYNGVDLQKDLEFKFSFDSPVKVADGSLLSLAFQKTANAFTNAEAAGMLDDENVSKFMEKAYQETSQEGGEEKEEE